MICCGPWLWKLPRNAQKKTEYDKTRKWKNGIVEKIPKTHNLKFHPKLLIVIDTHWCCRILSTSLFLAR